MGRRRGKIRTPERYVPADRYAGNERVGEVDRVEALLPDIRVRASNSGNELPGSLGISKMAKVWTILFCLVAALRRVKRCELHHFPEVENL